jgi:hypothetical protein
VSVALLRATKGSVKTHQLLISSKKILERDHLTDLIVVKVVPLLNYFELKHNSIILTSALGASKWRASRSGCFTPRKIVTIR